MKKLLLIAPLLLAAGHAMAAKPCEELKTEIAAKLDAKGVEGYTLTIVATDKLPTDAQVVGSCDAGTNKITYEKK